MDKITFGTAITCIDGRVQQPIRNWIIDRYGVDYVDIISEPGPDKLLAEGWPSDVAPVRHKVNVSVKNHHARIVAVSGHHDCAGNPATAEEHRAQIRRSVDLIRSWDLPVEVIGLWVNEHWAVEVVEGAARDASSPARP